MSIIRYVLSSSFTPLICFLNDHVHFKANSDAREGRVMIYNLVEAAQEFLSELLPQEQLHESVSPIV